MKRKRSVNVDTVCITNKLKRKNWTNQRKQKNINVNVNSRAENRQIAAASLILRITGFNVC